MFNNFQWVKVRVAIPALLFVEVAGTWVVRVVPILMHNNSKKNYWYCWYAGTTTGGVVYWVLVVAVVVVAQFFTR